MNATPALFDAVMQLPESDRFALAVAILDSSPSAMLEDDILVEAIHRQNEMDQGLVEALSYEQLCAGLALRSPNLGK